MVMLGLFSYVVDSMQMQSAEASARQSSAVHSYCCHLLLYCAAMNVDPHFQHHELLSRPVSWEGVKALLPQMMWAQLGTNGAACKLHMMTNVLHWCRL